MTARREMESRCGFAMKIVRKSFVQNAIQELSPR